MRYTILLTALLALLAACEGGGPAQPTPSPSPAAARPSPTPEPTATPTAEPQTAVTTKRGLYIVRPDGTGLRGPITGTRFRWSPDSTRLAVITNHCDRILSVSMANSGSTKEIASFPDLSGFISGLEWAPDSQRLLVGIAEPSGANPVFLVNPNGQGDPVELFQGPSFAWSPDGSKIAFNTDRDGNFEIYVMNTDGTAQTRLTDRPAIDGSPSWSPDGKKIAFVSTREGGFGSEVWVMNADGSGRTVLAAGSSPQWTAGGQRLVFSQTNEAGRSMIVIARASDGQVEKTLGEGFSFDVSSDGNTVAVYNNLQDGRTEISVYDLSIGSSELISGNLMPSGGVLALSSDNTRVIFDAESDTPGLRELYLASIDGKELRKLIQPTSGIGIGTGWSPDGRDIAFWDVPAMGLQC